MSDFNNNNSNANIRTNYDALFFIYWGFFTAVGLFYGFLVSRQNDRNVILVSYPFFLMLTLCFNLSR